MSGFLTVLWYWLLSRFGIVAFTGVAAVLLDFLIPLAPADVSIVLATCTPVFILATSHYK